MLPAADRGNDKLPAISSRFSTLINYLLTIVDIGIDELPDVIMGIDELPDISSRYGH